MMEYKGYVAEVEFDDSVGRLHGRVVNSGPYPGATFEATDVVGLYAEFHRSIDEYLDSCSEDGVEPRKAVLRPTQCAPRPRAAPAGSARGRRQRHEPEQMDPARARERRVRLTSPHTRLRARR